MAIIKRLTMDGLAGADAFSIELNESVNAFYGTNDAGSQTIITTLYSALRGDASALGYSHFKSATVDIHSEAENRIFRHSITSPPGAEAPFNSHSPPPAWRVDPELWTMRRRLYKQVYLPASRVYLAPRPQKPDSMSLLEPLDDALTDLLKTFATDSLLTLWKEFDIDFQLNCGAVLSEAWLNILNTVFSKKERRKSPKLEIGREASYQRVKLFLHEHGLEEELVSLETFKKELDGNTRLKRMALYSGQAMEMLSAFTAPLEKLKELAGKILGEGRSVSFTHTSIDVASRRNEPIPLGKLSLGEINALLLLVATLNVGKGVLLIEYPEFSLHVDLQRTLIKIMRLLNPSAQIIVTTHSRAIIENLEESMRFEAPGEGT